MDSITDQEFQAFRKLIYDHAGIALTPVKKILVASRLSKRLQHYGLSTFTEYFKLIHDPQHADEFQIMVNLLTTNETYFFREPQHFIFLRDQILKAYRGDFFRVWSAASSTGEEAYSLAMVLAEELGARKWEVVGSDVNTRVIQIARDAVYPLDRLEHMDPVYLEKYCLRGVRSAEGYFRITEQLKKRVSFQVVNLKNKLPGSLGRFDVIFLRNVLIYFDQETKQAIVEQVLSNLKAKGYFFISHSESLHGIAGGLTMLKPSVFQKP